MRLVFLALTLTVSSFVVAETASTLPNNEQISETLGHMVGQALKMAQDGGIPVKMESVIKGLKDEIDNKPAPLTEEQYQQAITTIIEKNLEEKAQTNLKQADDFLQKNKSEKDTQEIVPQKLQYKVIQPGEGPEVVEASKPLIKYTGRFADGYIFSSSEDIGPIPLALSETIPGMQKGLLGMKKGEIRRIFIHPDLAYGTEGELPPNSLLIFDVEVLEADTLKE